MKVDFELHDSSFPWFFISPKEFVQPNKRGKKQSGDGLGYKYDCLTY